MGRQEPRRPVSCLAAIQTLHRCESPVGSRRWHRKAALSHYVAYAYGSWPMAYGWITTSREAAFVSIRGTNTYVQSFRMTLFSLARSVTNRRAAGAVRFFHDWIFVLPIKSFVD